jgi:tetratricopeptide (TPR) repeat protein
LARGVGPAVYELHPLLTGYLRWSRERELQADAGEAWARAFTAVMAEVASRLAPLELPRQRGLFHIYGQNLHSALAQSERLGLSSQRAALTQSLAIFAQNRRSFAEASRLFQSLADQGAKSHHARMEASACHQLGKMAQEQRDYAAAGNWYRQALAIDEKTGDEQAASTCHQLGVLAQEQRDFAAAGEWYRQALVLWEKAGSEHAATTCGQLGEVGLQQGDFAAARQWYSHALDIQEKAGDEHGAADACGRLGSVAALREDWVESARWLIRSIGAFRRTNDTGSARRNTEIFMQSFSKATAADQQEIRTFWAEAGLGSFPPLEKTD